MLTIKDALKLYELLQTFIPEEVPDNLYDFTGKIIQNINDSHNQENFGKALLLMSGNTVLELDKLEAMDRIELFISGLRENRFLTLVEFCRSLGL